MRSRRLAFLAVSGLAGVFGCAGGPAEPEPASIAPGVEVDVSAADPSRRPHVLTTPAHLAALRTRTAQLERLRAVVAAPGDVSTPEGLLLAVVNGGLARHVLNEPGRCGDVDQYLRAAQAGLGPWRDRPFDEIPDTPLAAVMQALAYGYDFCHAELPASRRAEVAEELRFWGKKLAEPLLAGTWWGTDFGNHKHDMVAALAVIGASLAPDDPAGLSFAEAARSIYVSGIAPALAVAGGADGGWPEGIAYNRKTALAVIATVDALERLGEPNLWTASGWLRHNGAYILHHLLPNGRFLATGDVFSDAPTSAERAILGRLAEVYQDPHYAYLAQQLPTLASFKQDVHFAGLDLLYVNPALPARPYIQRPVAQRFAGAGLAVMRESWASDAAVVSFRAGDSLSSHQHADQNAFTLFRDTPLAVDSGVYDDYWSEHSHSYYRRTVAHNTVVVRDEQERFYAPPRLVPLVGPILSNDGGQNRYGLSPKDVAEYQAHRDEFAAGRMEAFASRSDYDYVRGEAGAAYSPAKLRRFGRELLFVRRGTRASTRVVIVDELELAREGLVPRWLLHTTEAPVVEGSGATVRTAGGTELVVLGVSPDMHVERVGGAEQQFWVDGRNYPPLVQRADAPPPGSWRLELVPKTPATRVRIVVELLAGPRAVQDATAVSRRSEDGVVVISHRLDGRPDHVVVGRESAFTAVLAGHTPGATVTLTVEDVTTGGRSEATLAAAGDGTLRLALSGRGPFLVAPR